MAWNDLDLSGGPEMTCFCTVGLKLLDFVQGVRNSLIFVSGV